MPSGCVSPWGPKNCDAHGPVPPGRPRLRSRTLDAVGQGSCRSYRLRQLSPDQLEFDCGGYTDGTSGSPLLADVNPATGLGTVIGVIGGFEQGGHTPDVSYAARFSANTSALYTLAAKES